jgi:hypothetical protein
MNWHRQALPAALGIAAAVMLGGCTVSSGGGSVSPSVRGSAACQQVQVLNLPSVDNAVDSANDFGAQPPNGATQLTQSQMAAMRADGKVLLSLSAPSPQFGLDARAAGVLLETIGNSFNGYTDNNQAPAMDRLERSLQGACGLRSLCAPSGPSRRPSTWPLRSGLSRPVTAAASRRTYPSGMPAGRTGGFCSRSGRFPVTGPMRCTKPQSYTV